MFQYPKFQSKAGQSMVGIIPNSKSNKGMHDNNNEINYFAKTNFRNKERVFGIKADDRRRHMYVIGKTGMGKTNLIQNMAIQDIQNGKGVAIVDPHGEFAEACLRAVPSDRINDVIYFNPADMEYPIAMNIMEKVSSEHRHLIASGLVGVFKKLWADSWGPRLEYLLRNAILALLEYPSSTLLGVNRLLIDKEYRAKVMEKVTDPVVRLFWTEEFTKYHDRLLSEAIAPIQNKVGQFLSSSLIRNIVGQTKSSFNMREIMDEEKILIMNLSKGRIGEDNSALLGAMMITKVQLSAMARVDAPESERKDFYLYVDEFQNFATESFAGILSEARKYRLNLILAHQFIAQLDETVRDAVFGNIGTLATFRIGAMDSEVLEKEFEPVFYGNDLVNLAKYNMYIKLMIDGVAANPFSSVSLPPIELSGTEENVEKVINLTRERYGTKKDIVEEKISRWSGLVKPEVANKISKLATQATQTGVDKDRVVPRATTPRKNNFQAQVSKSAEKEEKIPLTSDNRAMEQDEESERAMHNTDCWGCGAEIKVPFEPDGKRPVFCKDCLKNYRREQAKLQKQLHSSEVDTNKQAQAGSAKGVQKVGSNHPEGISNNKTDDSDDKNFARFGSSAKKQVDRGAVRKLISKAMKQRAENEDSGTGM